MICLVDVPGIPAVFCSQGSGYLVEKGGRRGDRGDTVVKMYYVREE